MSDGKAYEINILDGGKIVELAYEIYGNRSTLRGSPQAMRSLRDELTRAIVCAEVMAKMEVGP